MVIPEVENRLQSITNNLEMRIQPEFHGNRFGLDVEGISPLTSTCRLQLPSPNQYQGSHLQRQTYIELAAML